ncbi:MAG: SRPBCC family protein [Actinomycetota bacterium]|nr:SRPBCC family protein [Actinomycetota bacterium]
MQLEHSFSVPIGIDEAWRLLLDIERIGPCIPGATIESVDGDEITGAIKVRLGTIGPTFKGRATVAGTDPVGHRALINAHGESRSSGSASAKIIATLSEVSGSTSVMLMTEIDFTGKPAQLERTVISDAGARVVRQFAERLAALLAEQGTTEHETTEPAAASVPQPSADKPVRKRSAATADVPRNPPTPDGVAAQAPQAGRPTPRRPPRPYRGAPEAADSIAPTAPTVPPAPAAPTPGSAPRTVASSDRVVPRHSTSTKPHVEVVPAEPNAGLELLLKRIAPFAILVIILLLRRRRHRR